MFTQQSIDRFMKNVINNGPTKCWGWKKSLDSDGYARVCFRYDDSLTTINMGGHRFMMILQTGNPIPKGMVVMHSCNNPVCCNPAHLSIGTVLDNNMDKINKGRTNAAKGVRNARAKLTDEQVRDIKRRVIIGTRPGRGQNTNVKELAAEFNVHSELIRMIGRNRIWTHIV